MKNIFSLPFLLFLSVTFLNISCKTDEASKSSETASEVLVDEKLPLPDWAKNANIYEVNIRQYTPEGTFTAFANHLERLDSMNVDILWLMPIFPISNTKKKGSLGSYYAVSDYKAVNPQFGTAEDFKAMVDKAHSLGLKVILDWVPNHSGWDHVWITEHPEFYTKDVDGNIIDPIDPETGKSWGWTDVADYDYSNEGLRKAMIDAMKYWINTYDIDGFRQDVAHNVPQDFWDQVTPALLAERDDLFLLAESEVPSHRNNHTFHATYGWSFHHLMHEIYKGEKEVAEIDNWLAENREKFNSGINMHFTSNHDENSWAGTVKERLGDSYKAFAVLTATLDGIPLIYGGQEEPLDKQLKFFDKDDIGFGDYELADFYRTLFDLKRRNKALWNGPYGGSVTKLGESDTIYAFEREKDGDKVVVMINLGDKETFVNIDGHIHKVKDVFTGTKPHYHKGDQVTLGPWEYVVASNN